MAAPRRHPESGPNPLARNGFVTHDGVRVGGPRPGSGPPSNPFDVSRPYAVVMSLALALALVPGLGTGLLLVLVAGGHLPLAIGWPQLAQAHGQIQALGFVLLFITAVGLQLFPRFLGAPPRHAGRAVWGAVGITAALVARWVGQPLEQGSTRTVLLVAATVLLPISAFVAGLAFHGLTRGRAAMASGAEAWRRFAAVAGASLGGALVLYVRTGFDLASGSIVVPQGPDEALVHLELAGFAASLVFAVASRVFGRFLLLPSHPSFQRQLPALAWGWAVGLALVVLGWLLNVTPIRFAGALVELVVVCAWLWMIGLYAPPTRPSGTPYVTNPTRRWIRLSFAFLLASLALQVGLFARDLFLGLPASSGELSAARHALAQGFLLPLMVAMAVRLLPVISADVLNHRPRLELTLDLLLVGALLRVGAELVDGYGVIGGPLVALGGALGVIGFAMFAVPMYVSLRRLPALRWK